MTKCVNVGILTEQTGKSGDGAHGWDMQTGRCKWSVQSCVVRMNDWVAEGMNHEWTSRLRAGELPVTETFPCLMQSSWTTQTGLGRMQTCSALRVLYQALSCTPPEGTLIPVAGTAVTAAAGPEQAAPLGCPWPHPLTFLSLSRTRARFCFHTKSNAFHISDILSWSDPK